jgi:hypothetical protein
MISLTVNPRTISLAASRRIISMSVEQTVIRLGTEQKDIRLETNRSVKLTLSPLVVYQNDTMAVINAKGDMVIGNEAGEPSRMPIGSPNYFMVVDPTQDRGYKFTNEIDGGTF